MIPQNKKYGRRQHPCHPTRTTDLGAIMHNGAVVIRHRIGVDACGLLFELRQLVFHDVLLVHSDVGVSVRAGLLVEEAHGVPDLMGDDAKLREVSERGVSNYSCTE